MTNKQYRDAVREHIPCYDEKVSQAWLDGCEDRYEQCRYSFYALTFVKENFSEDILWEIYHHPMFSTYIAEVALRLNTGATMSELEPMLYSGLDLKLGYLPDEPHLRRSIYLYSITDMDRKTYHYISKYDLFTVRYNAFGALQETAAEMDVGIHVVFEGRGNARPAEGHAFTQMLKPINSRLATLLRDNFTQSTAVGRMYTADYRNQRFRLDYLSDKPDGTGIERLVVV